jgi:hypothetical protein
LHIQNSINLLIKSFSRNLYYLLYLYFGLDFFISYLHSMSNVFFFFLIDELIKVLMRLFHLITIFFLNSITYIWTRDFLIYFLALYFPFLPMLLLLPFIWFNLSFILILSMTISYTYSILSTFFALKYQFFFPLIYKVNCIYPLIIILLFN